MSPLWVAALCVIALLALPVARWIRAARRQWKHAKHVYRDAERDVEAATTFYGSMQLDPSLERHHVSGQNWREQTMVELSPEALDDPGPGDPPLVAPGPDFPDGPHSCCCHGGFSGEHDCCLHPRPRFPIRSDLDPAGLAPIYERLAGIGDIHEAHQSHPHPEDGWLDAQLADLYDWVRAQLEAA